jgi:Ni2+-binding GTPase involved in maturation of urease and hydrogenase
MIPQFGKLNREDKAITPRLLDLGVKVLIITNDVVTTEDAKHVQRTLKGVLLEERIPTRPDDG